MGQNASYIYIKKLYESLSKNREEQEAMKKRISLFLAILGIFLLLPLLLTFFLAGPDVLSLQEELDAERCLPLLLSIEISPDCEEEALRAQAVLLRSNLQKQLTDGENLLELLYNACKGHSVREIFSPKDDFQKFAAATAKTWRQYLSYNGDRCVVPYHECSGGSTRSGEEVFHSQAYAYLESVESPWDCQGENYLEIRLIPVSALPTRLEIVKTDACGYVLEIEADGQLLSGEYFRQEMNLPSSCFTIQKEGSYLRFLCKGRGHGLGLSQYGANAMALEGSAYQEILAYYFPRLLLEN